MSPSRVLRYLPCTTPPPIHQNRCMHMRKLRLLWKGLHGSSTACTAFAGPRGGTTSGTSSASPGKGRYRCYTDVTSSSMARWHAAWQKKAASPVTYPA